MKYIDRAFNNLMENENKVMQQILLTESNYMKKLYLSIHYFFIVFSGLAALTPTFEKKLLCQIYFPGFDETLYAYHTPYYWLFYISQICIITLSLWGFKYYICLLINCICFGTTMLRILKCKIKALGVSEEYSTQIHQRRKEDLKLKEEILSCIKMHLDIKEFVYINNCL